MITLRRYRLAIMAISVSVVVFVVAFMSALLASKMILFVTGGTLLMVAILLFRDKAASPARGEVVTLIAYYGDYVIIRLSNDRLASVSKRSIGGDPKAGDSLWCVSRYKFMPYGNPQ